MKIYYWYRVKKTAEIISKEKDKIKSFKYIKSKLDDFEKPSLKNYL